MPQLAVSPKPRSTAPDRRREPSVFYRRMERKLGTQELNSDSDLARLVEDRLPLTSVESLSSSGLTDEEIYTYILPRRTLVHRKSKHQPLTHDESDRAVRIARITSLAEEVFGDDAKAGRWLRKVKERFAGRTPMEVSRTEAGARLVEEMLLQLDYGIFA
ncbi:MAG TPA: antitoxin Xre/MbcA/ParS toxin-binding domain-containing protein [Acidobacteriaceae bacterium]|nr:antitoxin Xre/MbcA/ParS toxin-binding domain-containing protein [Acidobacteriaceae bacterium]